MMDIEVPIYHHHNRIIIVKDHPHGIFSNNKRKDEEPSMKPLFTFIATTFLTLAMTGTTLAAGVDDILYMTEQYPPYNYEEGDNSKVLRPTCWTPCSRKWGHPRA